MISPPEIQMAATAALRKMGADIEPGKVITFDGNLTGKEMIELQPGAYIVKLSAEPCDLNSVDNITQVSSIDGVDYTIVLENDVLVISDNNDGATALINSDSPESPLLMNVVVDMYMGSVPRGLWATCIQDGNNIAYISRIEFAETIHPIDDKFLPEACLPKTIDLSAYEVQSGNSGMSFNDAISGCFIIGGDIYSGKHIGTFWNDVDTDQQMRFALNVGQPVMVEGCTIIRDTTGVVCQVALAATIIWTDGNIKNIKIIFVLTGNDTVMIVVQVA